MSQGAQQVIGEANSPLSADERVRLMWDGIANYLGFLFSGLVAIVLVPIMLRGLGKELYGLWIAAFSLVMLAAAFDFGLGSSVTRLVAAQSGSGPGDEAAKFVRSAGSAFLACGIVGGLLIAGSGLVLSRSLHLSPENQEIGPLVFSMAGIAFCMNQLMLFATAVWGGLRRFDFLNLAIALLALLRAVGIVALLAAGAGILGVAAWEVMATALVAFMSLRCIGGLAPQFRFRLGRFDWPSLRRHIPFSLASQMATAAGSAIWQAMPIAIGVVRGSALIAPFYVGQKFPLAVSNLSRLMSIAFFPAASACQRRDDRSHLRAILEVGTRWILLLAVPICAALWLLAPDLLRAWLRESDPATVLVMRLTVVAVLAEAVGATAQQVLWGSGEVRKVLIILGGTSLATLILGIWLVIRLGIVGAPLGLCFPLALASLAFLWAAHRGSGTRVFRFLRQSIAGVVIPAGASAAVVAGAVELGFAAGWSGLLMTAAVGAMTYLGLLGLFGAREEERLFARQLIRLPVTFSQLLYARTRRMLRRIHWLRSAWYFGRALADTLWDRSSRSRQEFDGQYLQQVDPWGYDTPWGETHLRVTSRFLDVASNGARFRRVLEVGCGEGRVTEILADRCDSILAVDISAAALERARQRCSSWSNIQIASWDLRVDAPPGVFDLVLVMGVLECFHSPLVLRAARSRIVEMLAPGGHLLVTSTKQNDVTENAWWGRLLPRGSRHLNGFLARHSSLEVRASATTETHLFTLYRKVTRS